MYVTQGVRLTRNTHEVIHTPFAPVAFRPSKGIVRSSTAECLKVPAIHLIPLARWYLMSLCPRHQRLLHATQRVCFLHFENRTIQVNRARIVLVSNYRRSGCCHFKGELLRLWEARLGLLPQPHSGSHFDNARELGCYLAYYD